MIDAELEAWIRMKIAEARQVGGGPIPPPLENSPKCPRCSLVTVCLPDETRFLHAPFPESEPGDGTKGEAPTEAAPRTTGGIRRLIAARDDKRALFLNTQGNNVGISKGVLRVTARGCDCPLDEIRVSDLHHVALFGNIQLSTQALRELCYADIPKRHQNPPTARKVPIQSLAFITL